MVHNLTNRLVAIGLTGALSLGVLSAKLAYAALPWVPNEVVVRTANGSIVVKEDYGRIVDESCPGGTGSTVGAIG